MDRHPPRGEEPGALGEEGAFPGVGFHEVDLRHPHDGQDQPREAGTAAEIDQDSGPWPGSGEKARPNPAYAGARDREGCPGATRLMAFCHLTSRAA